MHHLILLVQVLADTAKAIIPPVAPAPPTSIDPTCIMYGAVVSVVVSLLKRWSWIASNPKWTALIASALLTGISFIIPGMSIVAISAKSVLACVLTTLAASVASHEIVLSPLTTAVVAAKVPAPVKTAAVPMVPPTP